MKALRWFLALTLALAVVGVQAKDSKSEFQALYNKAAAAMKKKDLAGVMALCTADFTFKAPSMGTMTRKQYEEQFKSQMALVKTVTKSQMTVKSVKVNGKKAEVVSSGVFEATFANPQTKKDSKLGSVNESKATWIRTTSGWKLQTLVITKETSTMDGKTITAAPPSAVKN